MAVPQKIKLLYDPAIPLLRIELEKNESRVWKKYLYTHVCNNIIYNR